MFLPSSPLLIRFTKGNGTIFQGSQLELWFNESKELRKGVGDVFIDFVAAENYFFSRKVKHDPTKTMPKAAGGSKPECHLSRKERD